MFDIGWSEMAIVALVALIVIGPRELPRVLRTVGRWSGKARVLVREFQGSIDQMVRDAELEETKEKLDSLKNFDVKKEVENFIDPTEGSVDPGPDSRPRDRPEPLPAEAAVKIEDGQGVPPALEKGGGG